MLVVDDDEVIRRLISVNLQLEGFEVTTAVDGEDALGKVYDVQPDLVTLDVMMPRLDGIRTAERLREDPRTRGLKIVMISACAQSTDAARAREAGVDAYLTKPFDPDRLIAVVRGLAIGGWQRPHRGGVGE